MSSSPGGDGGENSGKEEADGEAPRQAAVVWGWVPGRAGTGVQM